MKKLIVLIFLLNSIFSNSQDSKIEHANFKLQDSKELLWQKVFNIEKPKDSIVSILKKTIKSNSFLNNLKYDKYSFSGISSFVGLSDLNGVPLAGMTDYNCFIKIEIKENKYRVTITNIKFKPSEVNLYQNVSVNKSYTLEELAVRHNYNQIRKNKNARKMLSTFNSDFHKYLKLFKNNQDNW
ncbi:hypothetical protein MC378_07350 [Polaribacter sp. MSW13]|uniref:DUF4468 domain-containing protein n=1 Tax=Polaribacter marinus TaxID=2916838 RepID=A0A9X1VMW8_9FLAO|nr:hypothetical protein [Polaribacter marinus]MCI2228978.1 hypothetical protein [Polaribacter marinus]